MCCYTLHFKIIRHAPGNAAQVFWASGHVLNIQQITHSTCTSVEMWRPFIVIGYWRIYAAYQLVVQSDESVHDVWSETLNYLLRFSACRVIQHDVSKTHQKDRAEDVARITIHAVFLICLRSVVSNCT